MWQKIKNFIKEQPRFRLFSWPGLFIIILGLGISMGESSIHELIGWIGIMTGSLMIGIGGLVLIFIDARELQ